MTEANEQDTSIEVVYLGTCRLEGDKPGSKWIPKSSLDAIGPDYPHGVDLADRMASAFGKMKKAPVIGGIYKTTGTIEGDRLTTMRTGDAMQYSGKSDNKVIAIFEARSWQARHVEKLKAAERKAKADTIVQRQLKYVVSWIRTYPISQRRELLTAISGQLTDEAYKLKGD